MQALNQELLSSLCLVPEVCDLDSELHEVIDWISLGLHLGIKLPELKTIEENYPTLQRRRIELFEKWQKNVTPTWSAIVQALVKIGMRRLASELTQKHGWLNSDWYTIHLHSFAMSFTIQELLLPGCQIVTLWFRWKGSLNKKGK